mmetsp:Transcript_50760/g.140817  ORF Transcript_50760/g.140817 Transcript_50760/m.140817 type:complete len:211 (+) Transcript_50760:847-1479(+)
MNSHDHGAPSVFASHPPMWGPPGPGPQERSSTWHQSATEKATCKWCRTWDGSAGSARPRWCHRCYLRPHKCCPDAWRCRPPSWIRRWWPPPRPTRTAGPPRRGDAAGPLAVAAARALRRRPWAVQPTHGPWKRPCRGRSPRRAAAALAQATALSAMPCSRRQHGCRQGPVTRCDGSSCQLSFTTTAGTSTRAPSASSTIAPASLCFVQSR